MKKIFLIALALCFNVANSHAAGITPQQIYGFAKSKNYSLLRRSMVNIDVTDKNGNTAYCIALQNNDKNAVNLLIHYGANKKVDCAKNFSSTFLGMSKTGWGVTGAVVTGGVIAAVAGGGGGGGSSDSGSSSDDNPDRLNCVHGIQQGDVCVCQTGYTGTLCDYVADGYLEINGIIYPKLDCQNGGTQTGETCSCPDGWSGDTCTTANSCGSNYKPLNTCADGYETNLNDTCQSGNITLYSCKVKSCEGYSVSCNSGEYNTGESCKSGTVTKYKCLENTAENCATKSQTSNTCETCLSGYYKNGNLCVKQDTIANCEKMAEGSNSCEICSGNFDGDKCNKCKTGYTGDQCQYQKLDCQNGGTQTGEICSCPAGWSGKTCDTACTTTDDNGNCIKIGTEDVKNRRVITINDSDSNTSVYGMKSNKAMTNADYEYGTVSIAGAIYDGTININNQNGGDVYGMHSSYGGVGAINAEGYPGFSPTGIINISNTNAGNVYGISANQVYNTKSNSIGKIIISNINSGNVYGIRATNTVYNAYGASGAIDINNIGNNDIYGIYTEGNLYNGHYDSGSTSHTHNAMIKINNQGNGNVYGLYSKSRAVNETTGSNSSATIKITNEGTGNVYGIKSDYSAANTEAGNSTNGYNTGNIIIIQKSTGNAYGLYGIDVTNNSGTKSTTDYYSIKTGDYYSNIKMVNCSSGLVVGMYAKNGNINNSGNIAIHNLGQGTSVGIYADGSTQVTNTGAIIITKNAFIDDNTTPDDTSDDTTYSAKTERGGTAIGIYGASGSTIKNTGTITIDGADNAYGIWAEDSTVSVSNTGTITIDGDSSSANAIKLNGGKLFQDGVLASNSSLNLSDINGLVLATQNSKFVAKDSISGNLLMSSEIVNNGFDSIYTTKNTISSADVSGLNLQSQSALFNAKLEENGSDVTLTMKSFDEVVNSKSLAAFLAQNYREQNGESLFNNLKSAESVASLNSSLNNFAGQDLFSRMAFEDFTMLRELNFDMNEQMFSGNKNEYFSISGNTAPFAFEGNNGSNSKWSLTGKKSGDTTYALGFAFTDVYSNGADNQNRRADRMFNISAPVGYKLGGLNMVSTPRFGYAYGTYNRKGFNNRDYKGTLSKQMFGFMNEARLPFKAAGWTLAPSAELNLINYRTEGAEADNLPYALRVKEQNNYSLEAGFGLHAGKQVNFDEQSALSFNLSAAVYHEFGNPYETKVTVNGMSGNFAVKDENRGANRAVLRSNFEFTRGNTVLGGALMSYFDRSLNSKASLNLKYGF